MFVFWVSNYLLKGQMRRYHRMVYVRGPPDEPPIETYVKKVWFFLHESYKPHDVLEVHYWGPHAEVGLTFI